MNKTLQYQSLLRSHLIKGYLLLGVACTLLVVLIAVSMFILNYAGLKTEQISLLLTAIYFPIGAVLLHRLKLATSRLDLVPITENNLPDVYAIVKELCESAGLKKIPSVYMSKEESVDPCYRNPGIRNSIILGSDFYAGCRENSTPDALRFILAHQVGHFRFGHHRSHWLIGSAIAFATPILGAMLAKNLEYSADAWAATQVPTGSFHALSLCAVGKDNYPYLQLSDDYPSKKNRYGIFDIVARWLAVHAPINARINKLIRTELLTKPEPEKLTIGSTS